MRQALARECYRKGVLLPSILLPSLLLLPGAHFPLENGRGVRRDGCTMAAGERPSFQRQTCVERQRAPSVGSGRLRAFALSNTEDAGQGIESGCVDHLSDLDNGAHGATLGWTVVSFVGTPFQDRLPGKQSYPPE